MECLTKAREDGRRRNSIGSLEAVEQNLAQILNRLSGVELNTRETPHVTFEVDQMHIRRTIQTFGRITTTSTRSMKVQYTLLIGENNRKMHISRCITVLCISSQTV